MNFNINEGRSPNNIYQTQAGLNEISNDILDPDQKK